MFSKGKFSKLISKIFDHYYYNFNYNYITYVIKIFAILHNLSTHYYFGIHRAVATQSLQNNIFCSISAYLYKTKYIFIIYSNAI